LPVAIKIPAATAQIILKVDQTADGPKHDHADWAKAQLGMKDGSVLWLDSLASQANDFWPSAKLPFSFVYDGKNSGDLLDTWTRTMDIRPDQDGARYSVQWTDPRTGLKVTASAIAFKDFPAVEWVLRFENTGTNDTPILEKVQALDASFSGNLGQDLVLDQINGDDCSERTFAPVERKLQAGENLALAPVGGRPSNGTFPFFNLDQGGAGCFVAIGWTGQWAASLNRDPAGALRVQAGMELTHLRLHPGETIRTPRILLLRWAGDRLDAHNQFRRLLLAHYLPRLDQKPWPLAFSAQTFNRWAGGTRPQWASEAGQVAAAEVNRALGCDTLWFDAGWFEGNFPNGVGNWFPKPQAFPNGLKPIGEACAQRGLKFLVWYEPERVAAGTQIATEHPEFVLPRQKPPGAAGLFNLGDPKARRWLTDLLIRQITDFHIHTYRNDFNMDPLAYWRGNDAPDRQGITEIRYVEGFYAMWDELRARFPRMVLDDCASGGRRIDLEMVMRSVVQTRSDTACAPGRSEWDQSQAYGLSLFLPLHATIGWEVGSYACRSSAAAGFCAEWDILDQAFPRKEARACIREMMENRKFWTGDFTPLTPWTMAPDRWMAWQLHRPEANEGMVLAFRHQACPYSAVQVALRGLNPAQKYRVQWIDDAHRTTVKTMKGSALAALELHLPTPRSSVLVRYAPAK
jgi:alpha-galactosidase